MRVPYLLLARVPRPLTCRVRARCSASWVYNWAMEKNGDLPQGTDYVPMLFSTDPNHSTGWKDKANASIAAGATHLLGCVSRARGGVSRSVR